MGVVEVRRDANVPKRRGHRERMLARVEPPRIGLEPELPQELDREALLGLDVEGAGPRDVLGPIEVRHCGHERYELVLQLLEDRLRLSGRQSRPEVVEE